AATTGAANILNSLQVSGLIRLTTGLQQPMANNYHTVNYPPSTIHHPPSTIHHPLSTIHYPPSTIHYPPSTIHCPLSTVNCESETRSHSVNFSILSTFTLYL